MTKPYVTDEMAKEMTKRLYRLEVLEIEEMFGYFGSNYHIQVSLEHENQYVDAINEEGYTLKIENTTNTADSNHIDSMHRIMKFLHEKGFRVPLPVKDLAGRTWSTENFSMIQTIQKSQNGSTDFGVCGIHLLTYISGFPVYNLDYTENILRQWGLLLAEFHNRIEDLTENISSKKDIWNMHYVPNITQYMDGLEKEKKALVEDVLRCREELLPAVSNMPKGYIHGDFNETNILARETSSGYLVDGILDLEDVHYGLYVWDVGLMLAYVSLGCHNMDPIEGMGHALAGYLQLRTLTDEEIPFLKICIACRLCQSLVMGAYNFRLNPENSYFILSGRSGWSRLNLIWNTPNETIIKKWGITLKNSNGTTY